MSMFSRWLVHPTTEGIISNNSQVVAGKALDEFLLHPKLRNAPASYVSAGL